MGFLGVHGKSETLGACSEISHITEISWICKDAGQTMDSSVYMGNQKSSGPVAPSLRSYYVVLREISQHPIQLFSRFQLDSNSKLYAGCRKSSPFTLLNKTCQHWHLYHSNLHATHFSNTCSVLSYLPVQAYVAADTQTTYAKHIPSHLQSSCTS